MIISQAPTPFNKTTTLTLVPRYVILNQLEIPIVIKQKNTSSSNQANKQILMRDQQIAYNF